MAAQPQSLIGENQAVVIRRATPDDAAVCGRIGFEAFAALAEQAQLSLPTFPPRRLLPMCSRRCFRTHRSSAWWRNRTEKSSVATAWMRERPLLVWDPLRLTPAHKTAAWDAN